MASDGIGRWSSEDYEYGLFYFYIWLQLSRGWLAAGCFMYGLVPPPGIARPQVQTWSG